MEIITFTNHFNNNIGEIQIPKCHELAVEALARRFEDELKIAKKAHLTGGEVLLPNGLTKIVARDVYNLADTEPYGLRGCTIFINFKGETVSKNLCIFNCDPTTTTTFEVYLTLKQTKPGWNNFLPQFLKKMTRGGSTIMISSEYDLEKKKLYRSYDD